MNLNNTEIFDESTILISRLNDDTETFHFNYESPWITEIIDKMTTDIDTDEKVEKKVEVELNLTRKSDSLYGEYLFVDGNVSGSYMASCIRCLKDTHQNFERRFIGAYINGHLEDKPEYEEVDEIFVNNAQADLFFHKRGNANMRDIVLEACFLSLNQYPLHDEDCKGLCHTCGVNLNTTTCKHIQ